jgi:hypothetical protein
MLLPRFSQFLGMNFGVLDSKVPVRRQASHSERVWDMEGSSPYSTLAEDGGGNFYVSASLPSGENPPVRTELEADLDTVVKKRSPSQKSNTDYPVV